MIQSLIDAAVARLREELAGMDPPPRVLGGLAAAAASAELPRLVLHPGRMEIVQAPRDGPAGAPRPQPAEERMEIAVADAGPHRLAHAPLAGSVAGSLLLGEGTIGERDLPLQEGRDFAVDPAGASLALLDGAARRVAEHAADLQAQVRARAGRPFNVDSPAELSAVLFDELGLPPQGERTASGYHSTAAPVLEALAGMHPVVPYVLAYRALRSAPRATLRVSYSFVGIFSTREFQQSLLLDAEARDGTEAARLSALAIAALLTDAEGLRREAAQEFASRRGVSASLRVAGIELVEGTHEALPEGGIRSRLVFRVAGQLRVAREARDGFGILEQVRSPGSDAPGPIAIAARLGP